MSPQLYFSHYFTWSPCEAELCAREGRFDPAALRVFSCKLTLFSMITRCHWLHYFRQFRQIAPAQCSQLYTVTHTHTHTLSLSLSHTHTPRPPLFLYPFESSGVENNVSLCDRKKIPFRRCWTHIQQESETDGRRVQFNKKKSPKSKVFFFLGRVCVRVSILPAVSCWARLPLSGCNFYKLPPLSEWWNLHLQPLATSFFPLSLPHFFYSPLYPLQTPPLFFFFCPNQGPQWLPLDL